MNYYLVEMVYYKKKFIVMATSDLAAKTRVSAFLQRTKNLNVRLNELEAERLSSLMGTDFVKEL